MWGEVFGPADAPAAQIRFGYNCDYVGILPRHGHADEYWVLVNHEYISARPWLEGYPILTGQSLPEVHVRYPAEPGQVAVLQLDDLSRPGTVVLLEGPEIDPVAMDKARVLGQAAMSDLGVSVLLVRRVSAGRYAVVRESPQHWRVAGCSVHNSPAVDPLRFSGPAASFLPAPRGTMCNCGGATTPWGTFLTCEENFQDYIDEDVTPAGQPYRKGPRRLRAVEGHPGLPRPHEFEGLAHAADLGLDGRTYGWVGEVDPVAGTLVKHSLLGRFRHENVAVRAEAGRPLVAYLGEDRRGGHVFKFVSEQRVQDPASPENSRLFEAGTLYVSRWESDFSGRWIPLRPETLLDPVDGARCAHGMVRLPRRPAGGTEPVGPRAGRSRAAWLAQADEYAGRPGRPLTLGDLVRGPAPAHQLGVLLCDAFAMANACGGTPLARPEDIEVHPEDRSVYIAFTDERSDTIGGSPDLRLFPGAADADPGSYGAIFRLVEQDNDPAATTFSWGRFLTGQEAGAGGAGFACADNMAFSPDGDLWMMCDITTSALNAPNQGAGAVAKHQAMGTFGNNALFRIPTRGPRAGQPHCFATAPMDAEFTGLAFTPDFDALLLSVQHPGEHRGTRGAPGQPTEETVDLLLRDLDGRPFTQVRTVPVGSNFPSGRTGDTPKPAVVVIRPPPRA